MAYKRTKGVYDKRKRAVRLKNFVILLVLCFVGVAAWIGVDWLANEFSPNRSAVSKETTTTVQAADVTVATQ